jgi:hypothetical protein
VDPNPYSAPKATVADPVLVPVERPGIVTRGVRLLWISYVLGVVASFSHVEMRYIGPGSDADDVFRIAAVIVEVVSFVLIACLIVMLARGKRGRASSIWCWRSWATAC